MTRPIVTTSVVLIVTIVALLTAQDRPLVFQVGSELVVMDLIATDESGARFPT